MFMQWEQASYLVSAMAMQFNLQDLYKIQRPFQSKVYPLSSTTGCMKKKQSYFAMF